MKGAQNRSRQIQRTQRKRERQQKKQQSRKKRRKRGEATRRNLIFRLHNTILHHFPTLFDHMRDIPECRQAPEYHLTEILMAGLATFLLKKGSRNAMNNERDDPEFRSNYEGLFKVRLPHMDTVNNVLKGLNASSLDLLKAELMKELLAKKVLRRYRMFGRYYTVVIDGTHVMDVPEGHCEHCLHQTLKNGKIRYFHNVVEAKLVGDNGFCLSLATEWVENPAEYDKQDCEFTGFKRLAEKLKRFYPRLPICVVADGLYPNQSFFRICRDKGWAWIVTLKDGNLPSVWRAVILEQGRTHCRSRHEQFWQQGQEIRRRYEWQTNLTYEDFTVHWWDCREVVVGHKVTRFVYLTNLAEVSSQTMVELTASGRMRWKIENEGFNVQKHHGYGLGHQFSRTSMVAMKQYYQLMQIAHMINQLFALSSLLKAVRTRKESLAHVWDCLVGELRQTALNIAALSALFARNMQFRYD